MSILGNECRFGLVHAMGGRATAVSDRRGGLAEPLATPHLNIFLKGWRVGRPTLARRGGGRLCLLRG